MHSDAAHVVVCDLHFAGMHADTDLKADVRDGFTDRLGAADRPAGPVEGREKAVAQRLHLMATKPRQLVANGPVVGIQEVAPSLVAEFEDSDGNRIALSQAPN